MIDPLNELSIILNYSIIAMTTGIGLMSCFMGWKWIKAKIMGGHMKRPIGGRRSTSW